MKVDVRDLGKYDSDNESFHHTVKNKKKRVPNEFKKVNNRKLNKPKHINKVFEN